MLSRPIGFVGLGIVCLLVLAGLVNHHRDASRTQGAASIEHQQSQAVPERGNTQREPSERNQPTEYDLRDLRAQEGMAWWAELLFYVSVAGVLLLGATLYETRKAGIAVSETLVQTRRQADIAEDTANRQLRAYLTIVGGYVEIMTNNNDIFAHINFRNSGQTPAYKFSVWYKINCFPPDFDPFGDQEPPDKISQSIIGAGGDIHIFPRLTRHGSVCDDIRAGKQHVFIWGRADYEDAFGCPRYFVFRCTNGFRTEGSKWGIDPHPLGYEAN